MPCASRSAKPGWLSGQTSRLDPKPHTELVEKRKVPEVGGGFPGRLDGQRFGFRDCLQNIATTSDARLTQSERNCKAKSNAPKAKANCEGHLGMLIRPATCSPISKEW